MKGITVTLYTETETGRDGFNRPIYEISPIEVDNVLVAPASSTEVVESLDLTGKRVVYNLAIPKGDVHDWEDKRVDFFGEQWQVIAFTTDGIEALIPLSWNKKAQVARYEQHEI